MTITTAEQLEGLPVGAILIDRDGFTLVKLGADDYLVINPNHTGDDMYACVGEITGEYQGLAASPFFPMTVRYPVTGSGVIA